MTPDAGRVGARLVPRRPGGRVAFGARITALAWQRRGQMLATAWNPAAGEAGLPARREGPAITALAFAPDDRRLAVATADGSVFLAA